MLQQGYVFNRLSIGAVTLDAQGRVVSYDNTAASIFGETALREALGKEVWAVHSPYARAKIELLLRQAEEFGASGFSSMLIHMPDKVLQLRVIQLKDAAGVCGYCLMLYDITELSPQPGEAKPDAALPAPALFKLPISMKGRVVLLDIGEVAFLRAEGHYTQVYTESGQFFCNLSLSQLETRLPESFMRVHRSYIVNVARASGIRHRDDQFVICVGGRPEEQDIPVSRNNIARLRHLLGV